MSVEAVPNQKARTSKDIQTEFNNIAFRAGHLQHDIWTKEKDLKMFNDTLASLQVEYNQVKQQEDSVAKALADAKAADAATKTPPEESKA